MAENGSGSTIKRFFNFEFYITTTVVKIVFAVMFVLILLGGLGNCVLGALAFRISVEQGLIASGIAFGMLVVGVPLYIVFARMSFEALLVLFKINENLQKLVDRGDEV